MKQRKVIEVFTCAGDNAPKYMQILKESMQSLASGEYDIRYKCIINSKQFTAINGWEVVEIDDSHHVPIYTKASASYNHGRQLNKISKYVQGDLVLITDADVCVLQKNWDTYMSECIEKNRIAVGVNPSKHAKRFIGLPSIIFCMFNATVFQSLHVNFLPAFRVKLNGGKGFRRQSYFLDNKLSRKYRIDRLRTVFCDTGWALGSSIIAKKYLTDILEHEDNLRLSPLHKEFETWYHNDKPFVTHAGGSRSHKRDFGEWSRFARLYLMNNVKE